MSTVEAPRTEVRAQARYVRTAPRKAQLVADMIRGQSVLEARATLAFMTRDAARDLEKVLESAVANALSNHNIDAEDLYVSAAYVGAGPTIKRWRARARGRVNRIRKRTCHITVLLAQPDGAPLPAPTRVETPPAEEPKPKRAPRKKPESAEGAEEKPAEEKPVGAGHDRPAKRAPRKKAETATAEEKPKRARTAKPKAEAADEKPKRTTRKKKAEGEDA
jgi:large subunit ribosomal protein L22